MDGRSAARCWPRAGGRLDRSPLAIQRGTGVLRTAARSARGAARWGFALPPRDKVHTFARLKFVYATDPDLKRIGLTLEALGRLRNAADYQLGTSGPFVSPRIAVSALADAESAVALLDAIEADPARRAGAVRTMPP